MKEFETDYKTKTWQDYRNDYKLQKLIDRTVENILTALIEICGTVLTQNEINIDSYSQILKECSKKFGFSEKDRESLVELALQRNRLAHITEISYSFCHHMFKFHNRFSP